MTALGAVGGVGAATAVTAAVVQGQQQKSVQKRAEKRQQAAQREVVPTPYKSVESKAEDAVVKNRQENQAARDKFNALPAVKR